MSKIMTGFHCCHCDWSSYDFSEYKLHRMECARLMRQKDEINERIEKSCDEAWEKNWEK